MLEVLRSGQLSLGPTGPRFEALLADAVGAPHCAAVSSGTAGLHLCMRLAGVGPGDEVITSPYSFVASANCAIYEGATPVFADIDPQTLQPRPGRGRGGGHAADEGGRRGRHLRLSVRARRAARDLRPARARARRGRVRGARRALQGPAARLARPSRRSSRSTRTSRSRPARAARSRPARPRSTSCSSRSATRAGSRRRAGSQHGRLGFNYRLDDISAALGIGQLEKLDRILAARSEVAARYGELLAGVDVELPLADDADHVRSWFVYVVKLPRGVDRDGADRRARRARAIACAPYLPSIHLQSYMRERYGFSRGHASRSARTRARARWRSRSTRGSRARIRSASSRRSARRSPDRSADPRFGDNRRPWPTALHG